MRFKASHACPLLVLIICGLLLACRSPGLQESVANGDYLTQIILQFMIFLIPSIIFCRLKSTGYASRLNFRPVGPSTLWIMLLSILIMIAGSWLIRMGQLTAMLGDVSISFSASYQISVETLSEGMYASLTFALLPAICEEFVFRSVLFTEYTSEGYGCVTVALITALMFAMIHFDIVQFPIYLWCGLVLSMLTYVTQSVLPAILCHFLYNMYGIFGESYLLTVFRQPQNTVFLLFLLAAIFLVLLIFLLGEAERIFTVYGSCDRQTPSYVTERIKKFPISSARLLHSLGAWTSPLFILCIVLFFMLTFAAG
jgi:membrane protease YdiL (CAAX protease family)